MEENAKRRVGGSPRGTVRRVEPGKSVGDLFPEIARQAHGWDPFTISPGSHASREWVCSSGHIWSASVKNRTVNGSGCPECRKANGNPRYPTLAEGFPELVEELVDPALANAKGGTNKTVEWRCEKGHVWKARIRARTLGHGCPYCAGVLPVVGETDLATTHPEIAREAHGWDPTTVMAGLASLREWRCELGHIYKARPHNRTSGQSGCPYCTGQRILVGFNDLATTHPNVAALADGWDPRTVSAASHRNVWWKCEAGHRTRSEVANKTRGVVCLTCTGYGFDPNEDGYLYFLEHHEWEMLQIGITNTPDRRLADHKKLGWVPVDVRGPLDGHLTTSLETAMLRALRKRGAVFANRAGVEQFDGWSEAWLTSSLRVSEIRELLDFVYEDD